MTLPHDLCACGHIRACHKAGTYRSEVGCIECACPEFSSGWIWWVVDRGSAVLCLVMAALAGMAVGFALATAVGTL